MAEDKILRMQQLIHELNEASDAYYNGRTELMTDYEWDMRFDELRRLETETGSTLPDSPTQKVSEDSTQGQKVNTNSPHCRWRRPNRLLSSSNGRTIIPYGYLGSSTD